MPATRELTRLTYETALDRLGDRTSRLIAPNTKLELRDNLDIGVRLHDTTIITIHAQRGTYTLNSGGFRTATTKQRINALTPAYIGTRQGQWYIGRRCPALFADGVIVDTNGDIVTVVSNAEATAKVNAIKAEIAALAKQINTKRDELKQAKAAIVEPATPWTDYAQVGA